MSHFSKLAVLGLFILQGCAPAPRHTLTNEEKAADLHWVYSQFGEYYAPLEYKQQRYGFDYAEKKRSYLAASEKTASNEEFYNLMYGFVAEFRDAHTAANLVNSDLPARTQVAYLGFGGQRKGNTLVVTDLLPTTQSDSAFPIKKGDVITKLDGVPLNEVVENEFSRTRDLGQAESNLTYHMNSLFNRMSITNLLPKKDSARLTLKGETKSGKESEREIVLPWIVKDLLTFASEQMEASAAKSKEAKKGDDSGKLPAAEATDERYFELGFLGLNGKLDLLPSAWKKINRKNPGFRFWNTFQFIDNMPTWTSRIVKQTLDEVSGATAEDLAAARKVPANVLFVAEAKTFPTYLTLEKELDKDGKATGQTRMVAYMYLDTFSPDGAEDDVIKEVAATLVTLQKNGVKDLIVDMIDNGGGSLSLGMKLAQLFSKDKIVLPDMQFKLSETWLDEFEAGSLRGSSDTERELSRRVFRAFQEDLAQGKRLSRRFNTETLIPYQVNGNGELEHPLNVVLLVNEMCASMCDIFTAMMKDNHLATVMGSKTMGAGGNVVQHLQAPNSHLILNQTESLILRMDGSYIENNGIEPDVAVNVNDAVLEKYEPVRKAAIEFLVTAKK